MKSPALLAESTAAVQVTVAAIEVSWDGVHFLDETSRLLDVEVDVRLEGLREGFLEAGAVSVGEARIRLWNGDGRYNPLNVSGPLHAWLQDGAVGRRVRVSLGYGTTALRQFTGFLRRLQAEDDAVVLECEDLLGVLARRRGNTGVQADVQPRAYVETVLAAVGASGSLAPGPSGVTVLPYAWMDDETGLEELQAIAAADGSWLHVDAWGTVQYWPPSHWATAAFATAVQFTFTRSRYRDLERGVDPDSLRNEIIVTYAPRVRRAQEIVYEGQPRAIVVPPGGTVEVWLGYQYPVQELTFWAPSDWTAVTPAGSVLGQYHPGTNPGGVSITPLEDYAQRSRVRVVHHGTATPAILSRFTRRGWPVRALDRQEARYGGTATPRQALRLDDDALYIQDRLAAESLARRLADTMGTPRVSLRLDVPAVPALELGDRVAVEVPAAYAGGTVTTVTEEYLVAGIAQRYGQDGYRQELSLWRPGPAGVYPHTGQYLRLAGSMALGTEWRVFY